MCVYHQTNAFNSHNKVRIASHESEIKDIMGICADILDRIQSNDASLQKVVLRGKHLNSTDAILIAQALKGNKDVTNLDLSENEIGVQGIIALSGVIATSKTITCLALSSNCFGDDGIITKGGIASMISKNTSLKELRLSDNCIDPLGAVALAEAFKHNKTITAISLGYNNLCNEGAKAIANMLLDNNTLTSIKLNDSGIGFSGAIAITNALQANKTLQRLWIYGNDFLMNNLASSDDSMESDGSVSPEKLFLDLLENNNTTLTYLNMGYKTIHDNVTVQPVPAASIIRRQKIKQYLLENKNKNRIAPKTVETNSIIKIDDGDRAQPSPNKNVKFDGEKCEL